MTKQLSFGDNVHVLSAPETDALGLAGATGQVYGETTPSVTGIEAIGALKSDYAVNVHVERRQESLWFAPELLEFVDHAPGSEIRLDGIPKKWTRTADGSWIETGVSETGPARKPWWRVW